MFIHNLLNVLVQIANKIGLQTKRNEGGKKEVLNTLYTSATDRCRAP
jgi:hypothetical protein